MERIKKGLPFERNMVIVCEDTNTAPNYLLRLKEISISQGCWDYIEIYPTPPFEQVVNNESATTNPHKTQRRKRQLEGEWIELNLEVTNREQPVRYVRTVQKALEDGSYSEGWAVFDLDRHTGHARAATMAETPINDRIVHIAFSSRSIEMWFLLHFGQYRSIFQKTNCKNERRRELNCKADTPCIDDGNGECLIGFLRRNTALSNFEKNIDIFPTLRPYIKDAIRNAHWLRNQYESTSPYYERNPYTSMDMLLKRLLRIVVIGDIAVVGSFQIQIIQTSPNIEIRILNKSNSRQIIQKQHFMFDNNEIEFEFSGSGILEMEESRTIILFPLSNIDGCPLKFTISEQNFIWIDF